MEVTASLACSNASLAVLSLAMASKGARENACRLIYHFSAQQTTVWTPAGKWPEHTQFRADVRQVGFNTTAEDQP